MAFKIKFLGTGTAFSRAIDNYHNNAVVQTSEGYVLIDCGLTGPQALHELGIKPWEIAGIIVTHLHGDHCGGIEQIIWERYYTGPQGPGFLKTPIFVHPDLEIPIISFLDPVLNPYTRKDGVTATDWKREIADIIPSDSFSIGDVIFTLSKTPHVTGVHCDKPACGLSMSDDKGALAYFSGDTTFRRNLIEDMSAVGVTTIFHECAFMPKYDGTVHTHYEELISLPKEIREKIVLMHYGIVPDWANVTEAGFRAAKRFEEFEVV